MKSFKKLTCAVLAVIGGLALSGCATTTQNFSATTPAAYEGPETTSGETLISQLRDRASAVNPNVVFMIGQCEDKTGKFLDGDQLRYSRAVTQACPEILANYARMAGFKVAERNPYNMSLIAQEYQLSHTFDGSSANPPKNIGLIQHGGPNGGLVGATYMLTGAIVQYNSSVTTGGGGAAVDAIGVSARKSVAHVGIELRIVDVSTGLVVSSLHLQTTVTGKRFDFHLTRIIGDVATGLATSLTGGVATAAIEPKSNAHTISAEFGGAMQAPIDYAVTDVIVAALARQLEANQAVFYTRPVTFHYDVPTD